MSATEDCSGDVIIGLMITAPAGVPEPMPEKVYRLDQRQQMREQLELFSHTERPPFFVRLGESVWGLVSTIRCKDCLILFGGFCKLEGLHDGVDFVRLDPAGKPNSTIVVLLKNDLYLAFLCRAWGRRHVAEKLKALLGADGTCPFDADHKCILASDDDIASHYLELLLGRGPRKACPQAKKYLQGIARDTTLSQLPHICEVLIPKRFQPDDSMLNVLLRLNGDSVEIPHDFQEDMAMFVASKTLELVEDLGLDL